MSQLMLCTTSRIHPKIRRLKYRLGAEGVLGLYNLWCFCIEYKKDGHLTGMDTFDIAEAADYNGDDERFVHSLVEFRLLDAEGGVFTVHGWSKYNQERKTIGRSGKERRPDNSTNCSSSSISKSITSVVEYYRTVHPTRGKNIKPGSMDWKRIRTKIKEGYSPEDLKKAIDGNKLCPWHQNVPAGHSMEFIFRNATKIEGFIERAESPEQYTEVTQIGHHKGSEDFKDGDQAAKF